MRSISVRLTLAFLAVALLSVVLVAVVVGGLARREFDRFVVNRDQVELADRAAEYYAEYGSWDGLRTTTDTTDGDWQPGPRRGQLVWLLDANGDIVFGPPSGRGGQSIDEMPSLPVTVDDQVVGTVVFEENPMIASVREPLEEAYVGAINRSVLLSAIGATLLAILLGSLLAYTIARPVRELTEATQAVAQGDLGRQVPVRGQDELGQLGASFNRMSADLARSNQARQQMTADIAHDLRTPLSVILGYTEALSDGKLRGTPETYQAIYGQSLHLSRLIDDLRLLSLADAGQLSLKPAELPACDVLIQAERAYQAQAIAKGVSLQTECAEDCPPLWADADRMMQVLGNLISNALRHTPEGGQVTLSATAGLDDVRLSVRDTGNGIAAEDLPHIFERFYRGDKARQADGATGLGLAIARSLVEAQNGRISAQSTPGEGTEFIITLPQPA